MFNRPIFEYRDLSKGPMHVRPMTLICVSLIANMREPTGHTTTTDPRSQRSRASREGGQIIT